MSMQLMQFLLADARDIKDIGPSPYEGESNLVLALQRHGPSHMRARDKTRNRLSLDLERVLAGTHTPHTTTSKNLPVLYRRAGSDYVPLLTTSNRHSLDLDVLSSLGKNSTHGLSSLGQNSTRALKNSSIGQNSSDILSSLGQKSTHGFSSLGQNNTHGLPNLSQNTSHCLSSLGQNPTLSPFVPRRSVHFNIPDSPEAARRYLQTQSYTPAKHHLQDTHRRHRTRDTHEDSPSDFESTSGPSNRIQSLLDVTPKDYAEAQRLKKMLKRAVSRPDTTFEDLKAYRQGMKRLRRIVREEQEREIQQQQQQQQQQHQQHQKQQKERQDHLQDFMDKYNQRTSTYAGLSSPSYTSRYGSTKDTSTTPTVSYRSAVTRDLSATSTIHLATQNPTQFATSRKQDPGSESVQPRVSMYFPCISEVLEYTSRSRSWTLTQDFMLWENVAVE